MAEVLQELGEVAESGGCYMGAHSWLSVCRMLLALDKSRQYRRRLWRTGVEFSVEDVEPSRLLGHLHGQFGG